MPTILAQKVPKGHYLGAYSSAVAATLSQQCKLCVVRLYRSVGANESHTLRLTVGGLDGRSHDKSHGRSHVSHTSFRARRRALLTPYYVVSLCSEG